MQWIHSKFSKAIMLKSNSHLPKKIFICFNESPLITMKNVFCFTLKAFFVLKIFRFFSRLWSYRKSGLIRKIKSISKFMTSQPDKQLIAIQILPNISRSKINQAMKFGQLIEYNKRNLFLWKSCTEQCRETSSRSLFVFSKSFIWGKSEWSAA